MNCALCHRDIPHNKIEKHHLIPKTFKGKDLVELHSVCHKAIHATFTERELQHHYHTIARLLEHENIQKFVKWIAKKPTDYNMKMKDTKDRKRKRRR